MTMMMGIAILLMTLRIVIETFGIWMLYECMERLFADG